MQIIESYKLIGHLTTGYLMGIDTLDFVTRFEVMSESYAYG